MKLIRSAGLAVAAIALMGTGGRTAPAAETAFQPQLTASGQNQTPQSQAAQNAPVDMRAAPAQPTLTAPPIAQETRATVSLTGKAPLPPDDTKVVSPKAAGGSSLDDPSTFFVRADTDKNGLVSFSEFYALAGTSFGPGDIRPSKKFAVLDSDEDNMLTKEEIAANFTRPYYDQPKSLRWTPNGTDRD